MTDTIRQPTPEAIRAAADRLRAGHLVAIPSETVYGLGARADDEGALDAIFRAKGRPATNPVIAHVFDGEQARAMTAPGHWDDRVARLSEAFWPGPLTLVVTKAPHVPDRLTAGGPTVALRSPDHQVFRRLLREVAAEFAIAAPSANASEAVSPTTAAHVARGLGDRVGLILDGGPCKFGVESTVVAALADHPVTLLRPGAISPNALRDVLGNDPLELSSKLVNSTAQSPGQHHRHYAPRARITVLDRSALEQHVSASDPERTGIITLGTPPAAAMNFRFVTEMPDHAGHYAARLYAALHHADQCGCADLLIEAVPTDETWLAVRDRLSRASAV